MLSVAEDATINGNGFAIIALIAEQIAFFESHQQTVWIGRNKRASDGQRFVQSVLAPVEKHEQYFRVDSGLASPCGTLL